MAFDLIVTDVFLTNLQCQAEAGLASQPIKELVGGISTVFVTRLTIA